MNDEQLANILSEHPGHAVMLESGMSLANTILDARTCKLPGECEHEWRAVTRAAVAEIESGAIYGAPDRCAVCGGEDGVLGYESWTERDRGSKSVYWHRQCYPCTVECETGVPGIIQLPGIGQLPAAAAILRTRRILAERRVAGTAAASVEVQKPPSPPPDPYLAQREREKTLGYWEWATGQGVRWRARAVFDEMAERCFRYRRHRRRCILLGLERGPEPRIDAWICGRDGFDPRAR